MNSKMLKRLVRYKIYIDRAKAYIGYMQFLMIAIIFAKQFGIKLGVIGSILLIIGFTVICLIIGYVDTKLGIRGEEQRNYFEQNKLFMDIHNSIKK
jgi:hypothetical protein